MFERAQTRFNACFPALATPKLALFLSHSRLRLKRPTPLPRREEKDRYLHLLALIAHQYYRLQDNLVDVLLSSLQSFQNGAPREHKESCYARRLEQYGRD